MLRRFLSCQQGAAAAEMALITPFAVFLMLTAVETGHYIYADHQLVKAVRDGARYGARLPFDEINCRNGTGSVSATAQDDIRAIALTGKLAGGSEERSGWDLSEVAFAVSVTCPTAAEATTGIYETLEPAPVVNVAARIGYNSLFNGLGVINDTASLSGNQNAVVMGI